MGQGGTGVRAAPFRLQNHNAGAEPRHAYVGSWVILSKSLNAKQSLNETEPRCEVKPAMGHVEIKACRRGAWKKQPCRRDQFEPTLNALLLKET
jgi:hypothetical protein